MPTLVGMRVELPPGYVPPEPTHPSYGYLTPEERVEFEAEERARLGIVPGVPVVAEVEEESAPVVVTWSPPSAAEVAVEAEEATVAHTGWVPEPPPAVEPASSATLGEFRWDARAQQWVAAEAVPVAEEPAPDVAAAAGGRGASSSWTSADGSTYRWDARAQQWVTDPP